MSHMSVYPNSAERGTRCAQLNIPEYGADPAPWRSKEAAFTLISTVSLKDQGD